MLVITPLLMVRAKGSAWHRVLGYVWVGLLVAVAVEAFAIPLGRGRAFSPIYVISILMLVEAPRLVPGPATTMSSGTAGRCAGW